MLVNTASVIVYKKLGVSNANIAFYTSLLQFPWVIKPLWGPLVDLYWTKRRWVLLMQVILGVTFGVVALTLHSPVWWFGSLITFGVAAFLSATHDIAADGFYMIGLDEHRQALYVGVRSTFYRMAMIFGTGLLVMFAGLLESKTGPAPIAITMAAAPKSIHLSAQSPQTDEPEFLKVEPRAASLTAGTTTALQVRLTEQPKEKTIVSITRRNSSLLASFFPVGPEQLITVKEGDRLEFTPENWDKPQQVVVAADAKLKEETLATYQATAGNIALTWSMCFAGMAGLFLLLAGLHGAVLPRPAMDGADAANEDKAPFPVAAAAVFGTTFLPLFALWGLAYLIRMGVAPAGHAVFAKLKPENDIWTFVTWLILALLVWAVYQVREVQKVSLEAMRGAAKYARVQFDEVFISFFQKPGVGRMIAFLLLYRLGEALLLKLAAPFLLDPRSNGGLGLTQAEYGLAYGTVGVLSLTAGGILGGVLAGSGGLRKWIVPMCLGLNLPHLLYVYMAHTQPESFLTILGCVAGEQFGYGFGFAAYMVYMLYIAGQGEHKTSHFALCTGFMALSMMLPGMISGAIYENLASYKWFFVLCVLAGLPGLIMLSFIPLDPEFGRKQKLAVGRH